MKLTTPLSILTCTCGHYTVGFDLHSVQEVLMEQSITPVPRAPGGILGLLNLRGNIVPAISLHHALGVTTAPLNELPHRHIIISLAESTVSLLVDNVGEVLNLDSSCYFTDVAGLSNPIKELTLGIYTVPQTTVLHLDPELACRADREELL